MELLNEMLSWWLIVPLKVWINGMNVALYFQMNNMMNYRLKWYKVASNEYLPHWGHLYMKCDIFMLDINDA